MDVLHPAVSSGWLNVAANAYLDKWMGALSPYLDPLYYFFFSAMILICEYLETHSVELNGLVCYLNVLPLCVAVAVVVCVYIAKCSYTDL